MQGDDIITVGNWLNLLKELPMNVCEDCKFFKDNGFKWCFNSKLGRLESVGRAVPRLTMEVRRDKSLQSNLDSCAGFEYKNSRLAAAVIAGCIVISVIFAVKACFFL